MFDLLIRGGRVVDGSGGPWFRADVGIIDDRIAAIGTLANAEARTQIAAVDRVVAPGFVDFHSHSDVTLLADPRAESAVRQGITTQLVGNCGFSAAPVPPDRRAAYQRDGLMFSHAGYEWDWSSMAEFRQRLAAAKPAINVLSLVGHNTLRVAAMGQAQRAASEDELAEMRRLLETSLAEGAVGLSSGLTYAPGGFASTAELTSLAAVLHGSGLAYHTHMRDYGAGLRGALDEALEITADGRVPLFVSHLYPAGRANWGGAPAILAQLDTARERGAEVCFDITPWLRGGGPLNQYVPGWARADGTGAFLARLRDPEHRAAMRRELETAVSGVEPFWPDELIVRVGNPAHSHWVGRSIQELALDHAVAPAEMALELLGQDEAQVWVAPRSKANEDVDLLLQHPLGIPVTDGITVAVDGPLGRPEMEKSFGTFPRVLGHYVRDRGILSLEQAVHKLTAEPARRLGLSDRGLLRVGMCADVTIFEPGEIVDTGDERHGGRYPRGIDHVIVNGQPTLSTSRRTDARAGKVL